MPDQPPLAPTEKLGRALPYSRFIVKGRHGERKIRPDAFLPREGTIDISVHRLTHVPSVQRKVELAEAVARERRSDRQPRFSGWAELSVSQAMEDGRQVLVTPLPENIYHADIRLPEECRGNLRLTDRHLHRLASCSVLVDPPQ